MIKYRVYDTRAKKYLDRKAVSIDGNGVLKVDKHALGNIIRTPHSRKNPMFIIEQYTGLRDKNGVEIAVGDIVQLASRIQTYRRHVTGVDEWGCFVLASEGNIPYNFKEMDRMGIGEFEVIGNIHEY